MSNNYLLVYKGGAMAQTEEQRNASMAAWGKWFGELGEKVVDGGNPFGPSATVGADGNIKDGAASSLTGYSILKADTLQQASQLAKGCPIVGDGGSIEVYET